MHHAMRHAFLIGLGVMLCAPAAAMARPRSRPPVETPAKPNGDAGQWVLPDDYPPAALRNNDTGTTGFRLTYDETGKVTDCEVTASSGYADLDATTCRVLLLRASFIPGTRNGKPVASAYTSSVRWSIPDDGDDDDDTDTPRTLPTAYKGQLVYTIAADGTVARCEAVENDGTRHEVAAGSGLVACPAGKTFPIPRDASGKPVARRVTTTFSVAVDDVP